MKIYIVADFEGGCSLVGRPGEEIIPGTPQYEFAQRIVTGEVNAAAEGALESGATEIIVNDAHDGGVNLLYEELHPEAKVLLGVPRTRRFLGLDETFSGVFFIAYHPMSGTERGVLDHTYSSEEIQNMWLNDIRVGEIGMDAAVAGALGVPVVLVTSDRAGTEEAKALLGDVEVVAVKEGLGRNCAISLHPAKARQFIREAAKRALSRIDSFKPLIFDRPYRLKKEYKLTSTVDHLARSGRSNLIRLDGKTIQLTSDSIFDLI